MPSSDQGGPRNQNNDPWGQKGGPWGSGQTAGGRLRTSRNCCGVARRSEANLAIRLWRARGPAILVLLTVLAWLLSGF